MTSVKGVIDVAARLSRGSLNIELPALRLVTFAVVNWNDKDERFISLLSYVLVTSVICLLLIVCSS